MKYDVSEGGSASVFRKRSTYTGEPLRQSCSQLLSPSNLQHLHLRDPPGWYFLHLKMEAEPPSEKSYFTVKNSMQKVQRNVISAVLKASFLPL